MKLLKLKINFEKLFENYIFIKINIFVIIKEFGCNK